MGFEVEQFCNGFEGMVPLSGQAATICDIHPWLLSLRVYVVLVFRTRHAERQEKEEEVTETVADSS